MKKLFLAAGVAALAIAAPAGAKPGEGKGGGKGGQAAASHGGGHGGGGAKFQSRSGGGQKFEARGGGGGKRFEARGGGQRFEIRGGGKQRFESRGGGMRLARADRPQKAERQAFRADRPQRAERKAFRVERQAMGGGDDRFQRMKARGNDARIAVRDLNGRDYRRIRDDRTIALRDWNDGDRWANVRGLSNGCPPGLAMKNNGCLPPGQAKKAIIGSVIPAAYASGYLPTALRDLYRDDDDYYYRYGDGYLYQVNRQSNLVNSLLPLLGGGYMVGQQFPYGYADRNYYVPSYYQPFYQDNPYDYYRYNNGYVYDIDRRTDLIENIIPALGYGYGVGEMLPASYSAYNLPYQYRDVYADSDDYYYRYAPGAIYQVDRDSSLITSVASLLTGGMGIGQQLPMGYSAYNVPYAYRDQYYDTPDNWYRYANGNIYQVDPTTQLITAIISALV